jgi:catechol 2,3-dioxygenase-like lactoylglutathione lyase family enzyme
MLLGLRTAIYPVPDLARAKAWYAALTGVDPYFDQPFYVGFTVGGFELGLIPDGTPGATGAQALWGVVNAGQAMERMLALGATRLDEVQDVGEGIRVGAVLDPFGNRLGFIENPGFDAGKVR